MTASDCPHGERISPSTSTTPRRQKLNPWMPRGRELRPAWRRWVLPTSICSRMEQRMEAPREGVEVWWSSIEGGEVERLSLPVGRYCSSFTVEAAALLAAVRWLGEREGWTTAALITDIMSLLQALQGRGGGVQTREHPKRAMGPLWQRQAGRTCVGPRPLWTSRK